MNLGVHSIFNNNAINYVSRPQASYKPNYSNAALFTTDAIRTPEPLDAVPKTCDMGSVVNVIMNALDAKDPYTRQHSQRVKAEARGFGEYLGLAPNLQEALGYAAEFHDIGKFCISDATLKSKERLTPAQFQEIQRHPKAGRDILSPLFNKQVLDAVESHHERYDGKGYPNKQGGKDIPVLGRILCILDAVDAMKGRAYSAGLSQDQILAQLESGAGTQFDPDLVQEYKGYLKNKRSTPGFTSVG